MSERTYGDMELAVLIGGGPHMIAAASIFADRGIPAAAIAAPRHADQPVDDAGTPLARALSGVCESVAVVDHINEWPNLAQMIGGRRAAALCFGPAWIFDRTVRSRFSLGMINFNGIPIPRFLGGAHFTWQILLDDRSGGCFLQEIGGAVDRGPILRAERYELPADVRTPRDYERINFERAHTFLDRAITDMIDGVSFNAQDFAVLDADRLYLPRLQTAQHGYIDWSWTAEEIYRFCRAFDDPYPGARTFLGEEEVYLIDVELAGAWSNAGHPFVAGLVVRKLGGELWVAARDAWLKVGRAASTGNAVAQPTVREGDRFHTPAHVLDRARATRARLHAKGFERSAGQ